jgi:hypothetical protein
LGKTALVMKLRSPSRTLPVYTCRGPPGPSEEGSRAGREGFLPPSLHESTGSFLAPTLKPGRFKEKRRKESRQGSPGIRPVSMLDPEVLGHYLDYGPERVKDCALTCQLHLHDFPRVLHPGRGEAEIANPHRIKLGVFFSARPRRPCRV